MSENCKHPDQFKSTVGSAPPGARSVNDIVWRRRCTICDEIASVLAAGRAELAAAQELNTKDLWTVLAMSKKATTYRARALALLKQAAHHRWASETWKANAYGAQARATAAEARGDSLAGLLDDIRQAVTAEYPSHDASAEAVARTVELIDAALAADGGTNG